MTDFICPQPRPEVADTQLARPDWTKAQPRDPGKLWLDKNENLDPVLARVVTEVLASLPPEAASTYPDSAGLYAKLADHCGVEPRNLILTAGSDGAIRTVFEAYVAVGDVVLHTVPTFAMYPVYCRMYGARAVTLDYRPSNDGPVLNAGEICEAIELNRPKLVCLPNPDSPTGTVFGEAELRQLIEKAGRTGALVLIDEAYYPFHPDTCLPWVNEYPHLVVCRSTGKAWGCAGLRIGYAAASPQVAAMLHKVRPMYETNTLAVHAFEKLLDHSDDMLASVARLQAGKENFLKAMEGLGLRTLHGAGNFCHVAFGAKAQAVHDSLADLVYYRQNFTEPCLSGFSRFSSTTPALFQPVIDRIRSVYA